jgi:hypothetical protein
MLTRKINPLGTFKDCSQQLNLNKKTYLVENAGICAVQTLFPIPLSVAKCKQPRVIGEETILKPAMLDA